MFSRQKGLLYHRPSRSIFVEILGERALVPLNHLLRNFLGTVAVGQQMTKTASRLVFEDFLVAAGLYVYLYVVAGRAESMFFLEAVPAGDNPFDFLPGRPVDPEVGFGRPVFVLRVKERLGKGIYGNYFDTEIDPNIKIRTLECGM